MGAGFDYFVVYAEMRTGSNFLEENLNEFPGLTCHGEAFNPVFIGHADRFEYLGLTMQDREKDPMRLLDRMRTETEGMCGFRFFHDHDPRIFRHTLSDPRCAKIVLTRNPAESYVSRKIAAKTGQWRLNDLKNAKTAKIDFDRAEFEDHVERLQAFQLEILRGLQISGQTAFWIAYEDLRDIEVLNGLAAWLGVDHRKDAPTKRTKVQNPKPLCEKVANFDTMQEALARIDRFDLTRTPNFEPRRAPAVPSYIAAASAPLIYQPIKAGPEARVRAWLAAVDGVDESELRNGFTQKTLRQWKRQSHGHRSFTVIRHPVARLHAAFVRHFVLCGDDTFWEIRAALRKNYKLDLPDDAPGDDYTAERHRAAFLAFARFVAGNLGGQTGMRTDAAWATQTGVLQGLGQVMLPDMILREDRLDEGLGQLAAQVGLPAPEVPQIAEPAPVALSEIYDKEIEAAVRSAYQKDYMMFGFGAWDAGAPG